MLANALKNRRGMLIGESMQLVTEIVVRGRIERGPDLVSVNQFPSVLPEMTWFHR